MRWLCLLSVFAGGGLSLLTNFAVAAWAASAEASSSVVVGTESGEDGSRSPQDQTPPGLYELVPSIPSYQHGTDRVGVAVAGVDGHPSGDVEAAATAAAAAFDQPRAEALVAMLGHKARDLESALGSRGLFDDAVHGIERDGACKAGALGGTCTLPPSSLCSSPRPPLPHSLARAPSMHG